VGLLSLRPIYWSDCPHTARLSSRCTTGFRMFPPRFGYHRRAIHRGAQRGREGSIFKCSARKWPLGFSTRYTGCLKFNVKKMKPRIGKGTLRLKCEMNMGSKTHRLASRRLRTVCFGTHRLAKILLVRLKHPKFWVRQIILSNFDSYTFCHNFNGFGSRSWKQKVNIVPSDNISTSKFIGS